MADPHILQQSMNFQILHKRMAVLTYPFIESQYIPHFLRRCKGESDVSTTVKRKNKEARDKIA
jgi:hypothetical protein